MDWKNEFDSLDKFTDQSNVKAREIAFDKTQIVHENARKSDALLNQYSPLVAEVYKQFALKMGGKYVAAKVGDNESPSRFEIGRVEDIEDFERINVFPDVRLLSPWGVMVELPLRAENSANKCQRIVDKWENSGEGFYEYRRQDNEGGWLNSKGYFIPFGVFTQQKLAHALAEIYKEAMENYLKELNA